MTLALWVPMADVKARLIAEGTTVGSNPTDQLTDAQVTDATTMASDLLHELSGRRFGSRTKTVRPHRLHMDCGCPAWGTCGCLCRELVLTGPVTSVGEVKVDGAIIPASGYSLLDGRRLVRASPWVWPCCQDLGRTTAERNTWSVTYTHGAPVPASGKIAALQLAVDLALYMAKSDRCGIPKRTTEVTRQGTSIAVAIAEDYLDKGRTGVDLADRFLQAKNPNGLRRRARVASPDSIHGART